MKDLRSAMKYGLALLLFAGLFISCANQQGDADLILYNGTIYTVNGSQPKAEAVAVKDGKIVFVGNQTDVMVWQGKETQSIDLEGKTLTPGFIESHGHFMGLGESQMILRLGEARTYAEIVKMVADAVAKAQPGEWIIGRGWHQSKWDPQPERMVKGFPTHEALSAVSPDNPVYLRHASGHAGFANAKAMEMAGITSVSTFNETGEIIKYDSGEPTGIFNEEAEILIGKLIQSTPERRQQALQLAQKTCLEQGITSFHDAGVSQASLDLYQTALDQNNLKLRLYVMLNGKDSLLLSHWFESGPLLGDWLTVRAIKLYADGALGSRGALLMEPYEDMPGTLGNPDMSPEAMGAIAEEALLKGFQACTHAIGDRANQEVLDQYEKAFQAHQEAAVDHRFRIEHAQHLHPDDIPRFGQLGVIASMQGIHMASDRPWAIDRLGPQRIVEGAYVWQKLLQSGAKVINGTDTPVEPVNPIACFYASVTRQTLAGTPLGGFEPDQKLTRMEALKTYTLDAAYGAFEEALKGSVEPGKYGDFTVFSQDIITVPDDQILDTRVIMTIVGGEIMYRIK